MSTLKLSQVSKTFGKNRVLEDISLEVQDREFLVLLGPSGCGKSTLLRIIAGLTESSTGEIHHGERRLDLLPPRERDVSFVFQSYALYPHLSVRRNIAFPIVMERFRWYHHLPIAGAIWRRVVERRPEVRERVEHVAEMLELTDMLDRLPKTLSGGQRQRVALARAMVREPSIYLMDEPLSNLDARLRAQTRVEIMALYQRVDKTMIYVTHDQVEAMTMGTRVAVMRDGVIQQVGTPEEVYRNPSNTFVAGFMGSPPMNLIPAEIDEDSIRIGSAGSIRVGPSVAAALRDHETTVGVRPESIAVVGVDDPEAVLVGIVDLVEDLGSERVLRVRLDEQASSTLISHDRTITLRIDHRDRTMKGDRIGLGFEVDSLVYFDTSTGRRIELS